MVPGDHGYSESKLTEKVYADASHLALRSAVVGLPSLRWRNMMHLLGTFCVVL